MKVWVVEECIEHEGIIDYEVFLSEEGAFLYREKKVNKHKSFVKCRDKKCQQNCKQCEEDKKRIEEEWIIAEKETME